MHFVQAAWAIILAAAFDAVDGRIARLTHSVSRFGEQYDSLSDMVSFGVAPAMLVYLASLQPFGRWGWLATFLYIICVALRLARFNVQHQFMESRYFQGLPSPPSAAMLASTVILLNSLGIAAIKNSLTVCFTCGWAGVDKTPRARLPRSGVFGCRKCRKMPQNPHRPLHALLAATIDYEERQIPFHESHAVALVLGLSLTTETSF